jgi:hyperosmotically inducible protein
MFKVNQIRIETVNGVVTLTGVVQSRPEADRVVEMTKTVQGVREIRNSLDVRP